MSNAFTENLKKINYDKYASLIALVVLFIISSFLSPYFFQFQNILNILRQVSYTGIIALGMCFVIIGGGIDLSVGSVVPFVGGVTIILLNYLLPIIDNQLVVIVIAITAALILGTLTGALNGLMITRGKIAPFIATLGTMAIFRSLALFIGDAGEIRSSSFLYGEFGMNAVLFIPVPVFIMLLLATILSIILNNTKYGKYLCAVGIDRRVAKFAAINVKRIELMSYAITGFLVAVSAVLLSSRFNAVSTSNTGMAFELDAIAAVIIGGTPMTGGKGSVWGTIFGAIILGIINNMLNMLGVSPYLQGTVKGIVIIGAVYIQKNKALNWR